MDYTHAPPKTLAEMKGMFKNKEMKWWIYNVKGKHTHRTTTREKERERLTYRQKDI
jgi:hypothetical protein